MPCSKVDMLMMMHPIHPLQLHCMIKCTEYDNTCKGTFISYHKKTKTPHTRQAHWMRHIKLHRETPVQ